MALAHGTAGVGGVSNYYNEFDPFAAAWLRELISAGAIAPGDVDERSITDVRPDDLRGYTQCHFFAGIGGWSYAARLAGWPDDRPLWTGSCPCQPFSVAGKGAGVDDPRHLWPHFFRLIRACRPPVVMGEQVAGKAGYGWLDGVRADLAGEDYACRGVDIPACAVDAPHIRQRLYWIAVADAGGAGRVSAAQAGIRGRKESPGPRHVEPERLYGVQRTLAHSDQGRPRRWTDEPAGHDGDGAAAGRQEGADRPASGDERDLADADGAVGRLGDEQRAGQQPVDEQDARDRLWAGSRDDDVVNPSGFGRREGWAEPELRGGRPAAASAGLRNGTFWSDAEWIACHDGKARRAGSSLSVLVDGLPVGLADRREQCRQEATKAILSYAESRNADAAETVSLVRSQYDPQEIRDRLGVPGELPTPEVLLTFLLGLASALPSAKEQSDVAPTRDENSGFEMRGLRDDGEPVRPPYQRRSDGQPAREQTDTLLELSLVLARCADQSRAAGEMAYASPIPLLSQGVTHRVAKWRGFGNAIVPQVAAEVIAAFLDVEHILPIEDLI